MNEFRGGTLGRLRAGTIGDRRGAGSEARARMGWHLEYGGAGGLQTSGGQKDRSRNLSSRALEGWRCQDGEGSGQDGGAPNVTARAAQEGQLDDASRGLHEKPGLNKLVQGTQGRPLEPGTWLHLIE